MDKEARVEIKNLIAPEKETAFIGLIPEQRIFEQFIAKFPNFNKEYKEIYRAKYGLDKCLFDSFKFLISYAETTEVKFKNNETKNKNKEKTTLYSKIIETLIEWLCSYHKVLSIQLAAKEALKRGGILVYGVLGPAQLKPRF